MTEDAHVPPAEFRLCLPANKVAVSAIVEDGVRAAIWLKRAVVTHWDAVGKRLLDGVEKFRRGKDFFVSIYADVADSKFRIAHLGQHATLVGGVYTAIVIVDNSADTDSSRTHQVYVSGVIARKHLLQNDRR